MGKDFEDCHTWAVSPRPRAFYFRSSMKRRYCTPAFLGLLPTRAWSVPIYHRREPHPTPHWPAFPLERRVTGNVGCKTGHGAGGSQDHFHFRHQLQSSEVPKTTLRLGSFPGLTELTEDLSNSRLFLFYFTLYFITVKDTDCKRF